jgi:hypothetical protein
MRCTKCGTESKTGRKFCAGCGRPMSSRCPKCRAENAPSSAFCEDCGAALSGNTASAATGSPQPALTTPEIRVTPEQQDPSIAIEGERKTVTALFADIMGSTELMEDLDPEEARAVVSPIQSERGDFSPYPRSHAESRQPQCLQVMDEQNLGVSLHDAAPASRLSRSSPSRSEARTEPKPPSLGIAFRRG